MKKNLSCFTLELVNRIAKLLLSILFCQVVGIVAAAITLPAVATWYESLHKPAFTPPNWLFGSVWPVLYLLMGISFYIIWDKGLKKRRVKDALLAFFIQLYLNFMWLLLFFGLRSPSSALIDIVLLCLAIAVTIILFWKLSKTAGALLITYILWVSYAAVLNLSVYMLNR